MGQGESRATVPAEAAAPAAPAAPAALQPPPVVARGEERAAPQPAHRVPPRAGPWSEVNELNSRLSDMLSSVEELEAANHRLVDERKLLHSKSLEMLEAVKARGRQEISNLNDTIARMQTRVTNASNELADFLSKHQGTVSQLAAAHAAEVQGLREEAEKRREAGVERVDHEVQAQARPAITTLRADLGALKAELARLPDLSPRVVEPAVDQSDAALEAELADLTSQNTALQREIDALQHKYVAVGNESDEQLQAAFVELHRSSEVLAEKHRELDEALAAQHALEGAIAEYKALLHREKDRVTPSKARKLSSVASPRASLVPVGDRVGVQSPPVPAFPSLSPAGAAKQLPVLHVRIVRFCAADKEVVVENTSRHLVDLAHWRVRACKTNRTFEFPAHSTLLPHGTATVKGGATTPLAGANVFSWGEDATPVWSTKGETLRLEPPQAR